MSKMKFNADEMMVMAMFEQDTAENTKKELEAVLPLMKIKPAACELELHPCFQQQEQYDSLFVHC